MNIKIYSTPTCIYCVKAKKLFLEKGVKFKEFDISIDKKAREEMINLTNQLGVPVIVVNKEVLIGFNEVRLKELLDN